MQEKMDPSQFQKKKAHISFKNGIKRWILYGITMGQLPTNKSKIGYMYLVNLMKILPQLIYLWQHQFPRFGVTCKYLHSQYNPLTAFRCRFRSPLQKYTTTHKCLYKCLQMSFRKSSAAPASFLQPTSYTLLESQLIV